jgi:uncharacterized membrane protein YdbT with pleckstrin-like domain
VHTPPSEQILFHGHPSWLSMLSFHVKGVVAAIAAGVLAGLLSAAVSGAVAILWVVLAVLAVFAFVITRGIVRRKRTTYTITSERLTIRLGLVSRELHETRLDRVQNVSLRQSVLERLLGVGTVDFDTAGGAAFDFSFRGVAHPRRIARTVDHALRGQLSHRVAEARAYPADSSLPPAGR